MIIRLDSDYQIIFYPTSFSNFSPFLPHDPTRKNRIIFITNTLRLKIDGGQGGIILFDSQLYIINMYPKVYPLRRFLSNQMAVEMTRNTVE